MTFKPYCYQCQHWHAEEEGHPEEPGEDPGQECGRWSNGRLGRYCAKAGTEECDFECPYRDSECVKC